MRRKGKEKEKKNKEDEGQRQNMSRFGSSLNLQGELSGYEDLLIGGRFQGKIDLGNNNLIVEQGGKIEADIHAKNITIHGDVKGNVTASAKVFISKDAKMAGDISASRISIMDGAHFKGSVKMISSEKKISIPEKPEIPKP